MDLAESRENGIQQFVLVFHYNEEARISAEKLDAASECGLGVNCQEVGIKQYNAFEWKILAVLDIDFRKGFELVADEFDALALRTIHIHDIVLHMRAFLAVDETEEIMHQRALAAPRGAVEDNVGNLLLSVKVGEGVANSGVQIH
jgi:hypothetical protein